MSRIALCLFGSTGYKQKLGRGNQINLEKYSIQEPLKSIHKNIVLPHNCDVFIHSWRVENKDLIIQIFNPVNFFYCIFFYYMNKRNTFFVVKLN